MVTGLTCWSLMSQVEVWVNRLPHYTVQKERKTPFAEMGCETILLIHQLCKSIQIVTGKAADWSRICRSIFQQYANIPYLIPGWAIHSEIKHSHEVSGILNYSSIITDRKSFGVTISKPNGKSFSIIQVHTCWPKDLDDVDGIHCQVDIAPRRYSL